MKLLKRSLTALSLLLIVSTANSAVVELTKGSLDALKGQSVVNMQYDFSNLTVNGYPTLDEYITFKKKKYEEYHKGQKSGEEWYKNWLYDRENVLIPRLEDVFNKKMAKCAVTGKKSPEAKYTLIFKISHYVESNAGWPYFIGYTSMYEAKVFLVETAAPETKLATIRADYLNEVGDLGGSVGNLICKYLK
jgi:hypothetical protein